MFLCYYQHTDTENKGHNPIHNGLRKSEFLAVDLTKEVKDFFSANLEHRRRKPKKTLKKGLPRLWFANKLEEKSSPR